ncbi:MAG: CHAT domain-containing protein, partial [Myxococcales bacterium]|nr:CHAT domain-containing protein [Myxococcales bacterium]
MSEANTRDLGAARCLSLTLELGRARAPDDPYAFRFEPQDYTARTPAGPRVFHIEWSDALLADLAALRGPDRERAQRVGETLQRALRATHWPELARQLLDANAQGRDVHVTLRFSAAELYALPWELLTVGNSGRHLGELERVVLRYEWPGTNSRPARRSRLEGGRALVAWSAAGGEVPHDAHIDAIAEAYREGHVDFDSGRDVLANASASAIAEALARAERDGTPCAILHILCHGGQLGTSFGLALGTRDAPQVEDAGDLRQLLAPHAHALRLVVLSACDSGNTGAPGNHLGSVAQALHRAGLRAVIASRYPLSVSGSTILTRALYRGLLVELRSLERSLAVARRQLAREVRGLDWASVQLYARARDGDDTRPVVLRPFRGLEVFEARHRRLFFGRAAEVDEAVREIEALASSDAPRMFFVVGASGSGKSSLVRAAVAPRLVARFGQVHIARPSSPLDDDLPNARPLLLVLDQAEELFTSLDEAARGALVKRLHALATDEAGSVVLLTLRADFIGHCGQVVLPDGGRLDQLESRDEHRVYLPVMSRAGMLETIMGPARLAGLPIEAGLAEQLVEEVFGEPGSLPLLEFALDRMWLARDPKRGLTHEAYRALGGAVGALLEREADAVIEAMDDAGRAMARALLVQLVATGEGQRADTRRIRRLAELRPREAEGFDEVLTRLTAARLVVTSGADAPRVEIAHEELIRRWGTLRAWVDADRQKWIEIERVRSWSHLLRGAQLDRAREARARFGDELGAQALAHLSASERALAMEEARERWRRIQLLAALAVAIAVAAVAVVSFFRASAAESEARAAERNERAAKERVAEALTSEQAAKVQAKREAARAKNAIRVTAAKEYTRRRQPTLAALSLLEVDPTSSGAVTGLESAVLSVLETLPERTWVHHGAATSVAFSPDGARVVLGFDQGATRAWSPSTDQVLAGPDHSDRVQRATFSPDGERVATVSERTVRVWSPTTGEMIPPPLRHESVVNRAAFSVDSARIVTGADRVAQVWSADTGTPIGAPLHHKVPVWDATFSSSGEHVIFRTRLPWATVWKLATGEELSGPHHAARVL